MAACDSSEDRAERHYQSALASLEEGEVELALVDLRRVFTFDGVHRDARALYASTVRQLGRHEEAYGQYLRLVEQYPDDLEGRVALAEMAFQNGAWPDVERHGGRAVALAPGSAEVIPISVALDYRAAAVAEDAAAMDAAARAARGVLDRDLDDQMARGILVHHLLSSEAPEAALRELDGLLALRPQDLQLHLARLQIVVQMQDDPAIEAQLKHTFSLFPDEQTVQQMLLSWYVSREENASAEGLLREVAALTPDETAGYMSLVGFIQETRGNAAAMAELEALSRASEGTEAHDLYRSMAAALAFDDGEHSAAIETLREIVANAASSEQTRDIEVALARMLQASGDGQGADAVVAEVLAEDAAHVDALKFRAAAAIEDDRAGDAISDLRRALDQDPEDPEILTLMAAAHEREGSPELAGERLALAVQVSGAGAPESLRYAQFLLARDRPEPARQVLVNALRVSPGNLELTALLAETLVRQQAWGSVEDLRAALEGTADPRAGALAENLTTALMLSQVRADQTVAILEQRLEEGAFEEARRAYALLTLLRARDGDFEGARAALADGLAKYPSDMDLRRLEVALDLGTEETAAAERKLRAMVAETPGDEGLLQSLLDILLEQGRVEEAAELFDEQLESNPESRYLRTIRGALLVERGRIEEATAVLEDLYAEDSSDIVVANNLASLLATYHGDDLETLDRAATIARRLRGHDITAFQDTYGWIEFLRGNLPDAIAHLEPAAAGLPSDALVQYHLGRAYEAIGLADEALVQYERALQLSRGTEREHLPQFEDAGERLVRLGEATGG